LIVSAVVLFGVGSPIVVDVEESLFRAGWSIVAGIQNRPVPSHLSAEVRRIDPQEITSDLLSFAFLVPLFTPANRQKAVLEAARLGFEQAATLIDPSVTVPRRMVIGPGSYINAGCSLGSASLFGRFVFINRGSSIGHHARFGAFVSIGPGAAIAGNVTIGVGTMVGAGATILPGLFIGENAVVAAGSVVTHDVPDHCLVAGHPARIVRKTVPTDEHLRVA
jgi:sugar O-acyltransferase (sialic acid O-acetyltransferase NeuD family)